MALVRVAKAVASGGIASVTKVTDTSVTGADLSKLAFIYVKSSGSYASQFALLVYDKDQNYIDGYLSGEEFPTYTGNIATGVVVDIANGSITTNGVYPAGVSDIYYALYE